MVMPGPDRALVSSIERKAGAELARELVVIREARRDGPISAPLAVGHERRSVERLRAHGRSSGRRLVVAWTDVTPGAPPSRARGRDGCIR